MGAPGNNGGDNSDRTDGDEGFGLGGAIAIIGDHPQLKEHANPVLKLNNVDFNNVMLAIRKKQIGQVLYFPVGYANEYIFTYDRDKSNIYASNSFSKPFDGGSVEAVDVFREYSPDQTSSSLPFKEGKSSPMNDKVAYKA